MTDVVRKAINANNIKQGNAVVTATPGGDYDALAPNVYAYPHVSGVNGSTTNGPLDIRFDDPTYYG